MKWIWNRVEELETRIFSLEKSLCHFVTNKEEEIRKLNKKISEMERDVEWMKITMGDRCQWE